MVVRLPSSTRGVGDESSRWLAMLAVVFSGMLVGCIDNGVGRIEFEGYSQSGTHFGVARETRWRNRSKDSPYLDQLTVRWPLDAGQKPSNATLVKQDAVKRIPFSVRSEGDWIWLVDSHGTAFAAVDFKSRTVFTFGDPQPEWASPTHGSAVENRFRPEP